MLAGAADEYILDGIVKHMPHVQHARYVGRWNHNRIGWPVVWAGMKIAGTQPVAVPFILDRCGLILTGKFHVGNRNCQLQRLIYRNGIYDISFLTQEVDDSVLTAEVAQPTATNTLPLAK